MMIEVVLEIRPRNPTTENNTPSHQYSYNFNTCMEDKNEEGNSENFDRIVSNLFDLFKLVNIS